jgi:Poxvirus A32 protein
MSKSHFKDKLTDWYEVAGKTGEGRKIKNDKNFKNHLIKPCSMISIIGQTGCGKSTALVEFLARKQEFCRIIIFSGSSVDEPLYNMLQKHIDGIELIDNAEDLPELTDMNEEDKNTEKLIVFDDMINLPAKQKLKIQKWFNSARKYGFTCIAIAQNYTDMPIQMRRNTQYFMLFRLNDANTINQIIKNHSLGDDKEEIKRAYFESTREPKNFFTIDLTPMSPAKYRHNFIDVIRI